MATFDLEQQRLCVRVVYDGVAGAGKTTNVRQLSELFSNQTKGELYSPADMHGRTLYFDWLEIAAGIVRGFPLICQIVTVPGQVVLTPRRRHLLMTADVVVYVCDSEEHAIERALTGLSLFEDVERERTEQVPLVIQANKQDQYGAISGVALLEKFGRPTLKVLEAIASDGIGVVDTFVAAVRATADDIQARIDRGDLLDSVEQVESANTVFEQLSAQAVDPDWARAMLLEETAEAFSAGRPNKAENVHADGSRGAAGKLDSICAPSLPAEDVPSGFIWPAHTGRVSLREIAAEPVMKESLVLDSKGSVRVELGGFVLTTDLSYRYETSDLARQALVRAARERTQLGNLLPPETVLVVQTAEDNASWLWTVTPCMDTVAQLARIDNRDELPGAALFMAFGSAFADAIKVAIQHSMSLDLLPAHFGVSEGTIRYVGSLRTREADSRDAGHAITEGIAALGSICADLGPAIDALESAIAVRVPSEDRAKLARTATWAMPFSASAPVRAACGRIRDVFERGNVVA